MSASESLLGIDLALSSLREAATSLRLALHWLSGEDVAPIALELECVEGQIDKLMRRRAELVVQVRNEQHEEVC